MVLNEGDLDHSIKKATQILPRELKGVINLQNSSAHSWNTYVKIPTYPCRSTFLKKLIYTRRYISIKFRQFGFFRNLLLKFFENLSFYYLYLRDIIV